ncbi:MAG: chemotaxis-specific protein-glutamate methyltransferase CheB [Burkholderiaceae bacterium]|nr:chemotaxis-specific protein-glutamate methyltransferase CheB [Roseateles sp.]MBV8470624.1 chemotaxis-specific protein-glutamate methyltransferase CheB [Burkholderiaceae bacterium]
MKVLRVLVVEDSVTVRQHLIEVLNADPGLEVVGQAGDGKEAIALCTALRPDVISMDMMLPLMTGLAATEYIMAHCPTPILVVSASFNRGEMFRTYDAVAAGAVDMLAKPQGHEPPGEWEARFIAHLKLVARVSVITHLRGRRPTTESVLAPPTRRHCELIALGASTGGPGALARVLSSIPAPLNLPIALVMHTADPFSQAFADWLGAQTPHRVRFAVDGEPLRESRGQVVLAPPGCHLVCQAGRWQLDHGAPRHSCRPSIDVLFESLARETKAATVACLLTGMGRDGAAGLLAIQQAGGHTIAQDESTSVVYGMPREAALLGAAQQILALPDIGHTLAAIDRGWV